MGQQQLMLLVIATIIVGTAILIGVNRFNDSSDNVNEDEIRNALMVIAARAQVWYRRPAGFGGGGYSFAAITLEKIHFDTSIIAGTFAISNLQSESFRVTGTSKIDNTCCYTIDIYPESIVMEP
jgi:hypothetical protein